MGLSGFASFGPSSSESELGIAVIGLSEGQSVRRRPLRRRAMSKRRRRLRLRRRVLYKNDTDTHILISNFCPRQFNFLFAKIFAVKRRIYSKDGYSTPFTDIIQTWMYFSWKTYDHLESSNKNLRHTSSKENFY